MALSEYWKGNMEFMKGNIMNIVLTKGMLEMTD